MKSEKRPLAQLVASTVEWNYNLSIKRTVKYMMYGCFMLGTEN